MSAAETTMAHRKSHAHRRILRSRNAGKVWRTFWRRHRPGPNWSHVPDPNHIGDWCMNDCPACLVRSAIEYPDG